MGRQRFGEHRFEVKLPDKYRSRHLYVVGRSGSGKTNLLRTLIYQGPVGRPRPGGAGPGTGDDQRRAAALHPTGAGPTT